MSLEGFSEEAFECLGEIRFAGFAPVSTIDYPGEVAAVIYMPGCNLRCPYCHNKGIVEGKGDDLKWDDIRSRLEQHVGVITGVVITGGEPTLYYNALHALLGYLVYETDLKIKLDTNGTGIKALRDLMCYVDYLAMDFKCPESSWGTFTTGCPWPYDHLAEIALMAQNRNMPMELRTTVHRAVLPLASLGEMAALRTRQGCCGIPWYLQRFRPCECFDAELNDIPNYTPEELAFVARELGAFTRGCGEYDVLPGN